MTEEITNKTLAVLIAAAIVVSIVTGWIIFENNNQVIQMNEELDRIIDQDIIQNNYMIGMYKEIIANQELIEYNQEILINQFVPIQEEEITCYKSDYGVYCPNFTYQETTWWNTTWS